MNEETWRYTKTQTTNASTSQLSEIHTQIKET